MQKRCAMCPVVFEAKRATAKYCSRKCSMRASRAGAAAAVRPDPPAAGDAVEVATLAELVEVGRVDSPAGRCALVLARRIDAGMESGSGLAALVREHRAAMADALGGADVEDSPLDALRRRREQKALDDLFNLDGDAG